MRVKVTFPLPPGGKNHKAIREQVLLDESGKLTARLLAAAQAAAGPGQEATLHRTYSKAGRVSVRINSDGEGDRQGQRIRLETALGRVRP